MRGKLLELAARVEAATGPDRELDAEIAATLRGNDDDLPNPSGFVGVVGSAEGAYLASDYTASLDAAMTLVPEGRDWEVKTAPHRKGARSPVWLNGAHCETSDAATPALALTAAALRAHAAKEDRT